LIIELFITTDMFCGITTEYASPLSNATNDARKPSTVTGPMMCGAITNVLLCRKSGSAA
jgi:hypothetical protein